ncbi:uncharacterized protein LOC107320165 isoform X3 [Coturnix japonica]|uniref:uncharacterized protein LOC107320165 isoform X3 n=1 Tax=Coturnix japonica TaxID=93934 RepID=UPI000777A614|nr:uncharacterized protein LOC107320165 isoform X3 [Coturnix japonica]
MLLFLPTLLARSYISATMSQHIRKPYGSAVPLFIFFLLVDVGVSDGNVSEENATLSHRRTQVPLLTTLEPCPQHRSLTGLTARWYKEDEKGKTDLQENNMTMLPNNSRVFMSGDLSQGAVSLVILNVTTSDHGIYFCEVTLPDGKVMTGDGDKAEDQEGSRLVWYRRIYWNNHWGCGSWYRRPGSSDYHFNATAKEMHPLHETRLSPSLICRAKGSTGRCKG